MTFTTEAIAPILSNPSPEDGERDVPMDLAQLQFTLKDYQGDAMEYTVQTSPNIGSDHKVGVHDGTYTAPISGMTYGATYRWYVNVTDGTHWTRKLFSFETGYPSQFDPYEFGWHYRKQITINYTQVADNLENFPVLISTIDSDLMKAQDDGGDILFMTGTGVAKRQYHEIEIFDQTTGSLVAWINVPALSSSQDTIFYMYYGNPTCINQQYPERTWNSHFKAVWHLNNNPMGSIIDSTLKDNDGTTKGDMTSSDLVDGKIGKCLHFDGADDFISFAKSISRDNTGSVTAWVHTSSNEWCLVYADSTKDAVKPYIIFGMRDIGEFYFARDVDSGSSNYQGMKDVNMNDGNWHFVVWISLGSGSGNKFYFDGNEVTLNWQDEQNPNGVWFDDQTTNGYSIGAFDRPMRQLYWSGLLDEIRIANIPLSAAWVTTEYANQNDPAGFYTIGPEEPGP
jgi:hypothetical protein